MAPLEVIGAGCGRTGTESLRLALDMLGYTTHHGYSFFEDSTLDPNDFTRAALEPENTDWDKLYEKYDAAVDWSTAAFYKSLLTKYPSAKVLLTVRDADSWYKSIRNTLHLISIRREDMTPDHPLYSFSVMCKTVIFDGVLSDPEKFKDEEAIKKLYLDHIEDVKKTVPADRLYVMELGSGWEGLCKFLGKEVPKEPYPRSNSTNNFQKRVAVIYEGLGIKNAELNKAASTAELDKAAAAAPSPATI